MRRTLFVVALLAALVPTAGQSASAQVVALAPFSGYSTGTAVHAGALESGTTRLVDSEIAFSGANVCVLGQPISSGLGYAANANLVNTGNPLASLLATNTGANAVNQSKSFTYLIPNGDGTYGLVSETHQILAPITLIAGIAGLPV